MAILFLATETRKHGIALKDLKQKALVGFGVLVVILFLPRKHGIALKDLKQ